MNLEINFVFCAIIFLPGVREFLLFSIVEEYCLAFLFVWKYFESICDQNSWDLVHEAVGSHQGFLGKSMWKFFVNIYLPTTDYSVVYGFQRNFYPMCQLHLINNACLECSVWKILTHCLVLTAKDLISTNAWEWREDGLYHFSNSRLVFISSQYLFDIHSWCSKANFLSFFFFFKSEQKGKKNATLGCHGVFLIRTDHPCLLINLLSSSLAFII